MYKIFKNALFFIICCIFLYSCAGVWDPASQKDVPADVDERVKKNIEEGRGVKIFDKRNKSSGIGSFASSNPIWRASLDVLNFMVLSSADYGGGIIITDWYNENNNNESIKITIRFLSDEIRIDGFDVIIHQKRCDQDDKTNCNIKKINNKLNDEIKLAILKRATIIDRKLTEKKVKEFKKQFPEHKARGDEKD
tara:strand:+ start:321 stop:902 length:582 start_codon:yes stop_codon:yes gene_type:complete